MQKRAKSCEHAWVKTRRRFFAALALGALGCSGDATGPSAGETVPWTDASLRRVWGSAPDDVWVVGTRGAVLRYDGSVWHALDSNTTEQLNAISGCGVNCAWAVGHNGTVLKWDGAVWSDVSLPEHDEELLGVWVARPNNVYMSGIKFGSALLAQFNGTDWATATLTQAGSLWDIWGSGEADVWAVGSGRGAVGFLLHYAGTAWNYGGYEGGQLRTIWGTAPTDVWAAGYDVPIQHWDGRGWAIATAEVYRIFSMWGSGEQDVWAVGFDGAILHYDGATWTAIESPTIEHLWGIWGTAAEDIWAVGGNGTLLHFDGATWESSRRHFVN